MSESKGYTFVVEKGITKGGKYGKSRRYREPNEPSTLVQAWKTHAGKTGSIEAMSKEPKGRVAVFTKQNLLAKAVHAAFYDHHELILSPDVIWLTIAQGLANHVDQNAEKLRSNFVSFEDKEEIVISRPEFVKGSPDNDWEGVFPEFAEKIAAKTKSNIAELIECDFTTTTVVERLASYVTLMDTVQHYFSYTMACGCGFPSITLAGTVSDWEKIRTKAERLKEYELDWWLSDLLPALDQFVLAAKGEPDLNFWRSLCNINVGTSFPVYEPLTGWIQVFFPYLNAVGWDDFNTFEEAQDGNKKKQLRRNDALGNYKVSFESRVNISNFKTSDETFGPPPAGTLPGVKLENFPPALSSAPFVYKDLQTRKKHDMAFCSGITCLVQHGNEALEPMVGWAVLDSGIEHPL
uniref:DUF4419 domain-containing protein n=1 Tax=Aplanochytrium stocchinoi TaxID=215587 RepID=A0A7S3PH88_9STRA